MFSFHIFFVYLCPYKTDDNMVTNRKQYILFLLLWMLTPCVMWAQDDAFNLLRTRTRLQSTSISR